jgi:hypothetical protein
MWQWMHRSIFFFYLGTSFTPRLLYPRVKIPGTHWIGGLGDPRAGLDDAKIKFLTLLGLELRPLGQVAILTALSPFLLNVSYLKLHLLTWSRHIWTTKPVYRAVEGL